MVKPLHIRINNSVALWIKQNIAPWYQDYSLNLPHYICTNSKITDHCLCTSFTHSLESENEGKLLSFAAQIDVTSDKWN